MTRATATLEELGITRLCHAGRAPDPETEVTGITVDSREVKAGFVFVAIPGTRLDGADFAQYAVRQGAVAVIATKDGVKRAKATMGGLLKVPFLICRNPRAELARLAALWYGTQPETMVAVTGTNGKTSVAQFVQQIWRADGRAAAALGTTGVIGEGFEEPLSMTTPEPLTLHALLARLAEKGCTHASMEASSHGLAQHRLDGVRLAAAALTNITRDHMDYHADHDAYVAAKLRLFDELLPPDGVAVLNGDDAAFPLARVAAAGREIITVGRSAEAALRLTGASFRRYGQDITVGWKGEEHKISLSLIGDFQAQNVLSAAALALATGTSAEAVFAALPKLTGVRGRMERAAIRENGAAIYVDYAHTPDALATAIDALRPHCQGRLIVVFGAGGDRDPGKRVMMGMAVAKRADSAIVTDDNPRSEDPAAIRKAVLAGCPEADEIGDRTAAILAGIDALKAPGDCLLIAGKGHEQGQEVAGKVLPFDDVEQARAAVTALDGIEQELAS